MTAFPAGYSLRPAEPGDVEAIAGIDETTEAMFAPYGGVPPRGPARNFRRAVLAVLREGNAWLAETAAAEPVGFMLLLDMDGHPYLEEIAVTPAHGRRGLGAAMLEWVVGWCAGNGHGEIRLRTFTHVPWNRPFYLKHGFVDVPAAEWGPGMREVDRKEGEIGFDLSKRTVMKRLL